MFQFAIIGKMPLVTKLEALFPHKKNNMLN